MEPTGERHHAHRDDHGHHHGIAGVDPVLLSTRRGLSALAWSFAGLLATALLQLVVAVLSGSVALLGDTLHNFADAATAIPLGVAFWLARRRATRRFTYGLGRAEDLAGLAIVLTILASGVVVIYASIDRLLHPRPVEMLGAVAAAALVGFLGNEAVAVYRIRVGRAIGSEALVADGVHARVDGWVSLSVLAGALGVWAGFPVADPLIGLGLGATILVLTVRSARSVLLRMLDGIETDVLDAVAHAAQHAPAVQEVTDVRARWVGHRVHVDVSVTVPGHLSVAEGHEVGRDVRHQLLHHVPHLGRVNVHVDPAGRGGEAHHRIDPHAHGDLPAHAHD